LARENSRRAGIGGLAKEFFRAKARRFAKRAKAVNRGRRVFVANGRLNGMRRRRKITPALTPLLKREERPVIGHAEP
jgi:hypothetical protein